ncbi:uncharacterized protein [Pyxicephalus adspersus]
MMNLKFYRNEICFEPYGVCIDSLHDWKHDYYKLENNHNFIQWLFPLREPGMNKNAWPLTEKEIEEMKKDKEVMKRFLKSYELMLGFYGIEINTETGELNLAKNWRERFTNLNNNTHNNLRITRILKCLGELGYEHFQAPLVRFFLEQILCNSNLQNVKTSALNYFLFTVKNKRERKELVLFAWEYYESKEDFIWGPVETLQKLKHKATEINANKRSNNIQISEKENEGTPPASEPIEENENRGYHMFTNDNGETPMEVSECGTGGKVNEETAKQWNSNNEKENVMPPTESEHKENQGLPTVCGTGINGGIPIQCNSRDEKENGMPPTDSGSREVKDNGRSPTKCGYESKENEGILKQYVSNNEKENEVLPTESGLKEDKENQGLPTVCGTGINGGIPMQSNSRDEKVNGMPPTDSGSREVKDNGSSPTECGYGDKKNEGISIQYNSNNEKENEVPPTESDLKKDEGNGAPPTECSSGDDKGKEGTPIQSIPVKDKENERPLTRLDEDKQSGKIPSVCGSDTTNEVGSTITAANTQPTVIAHSDSVSSSSSKL